MKAIALVSLVSALVACSNDRPESSSLSNFEHLDSVEYSFVEGKLEGMKVTSFENPEPFPPSYQTTFTFSFHLPCASDIELFTHHVSYNANGMNLRLAAVTSKATEPSFQPRCVVANVRSREITVGGKYDSLEGINLLWQTSGLTVSASGATSVGEVRSVKAISKREICPPGAFCQVSGTTVIAEVELACDETMGPVTYSSEQSRAGDARLIFGYLALSTIKTGEACSGTKTETLHLSFLNRYASELENVHLYTLRSKWGAQ